MSTILYKRLFEVRILHDYFLSKVEGTSIYDLPAPQSVALLNEKVTLSQYQVPKFLSIKPSAITRNLFRNYHLKIAAEATGLVVGVEVKPRRLPTGEEIYFPFIEGLGSQTLGFQIFYSSPGVKNATNQRIRTPAHFQYYFSNQNPDGLKVFPALSQPVAAFQTGASYETSELAVLGGNLSQALESTNSADPGKWQTINGTGLANERDRVLIGQQFGYTIPFAATQVVATLKDLGGDEIKNQSYTRSEPFAYFNLDFRMRDSATGPLEISEGTYQLEIQADGSLVENKVIKLSNDLYQPSGLGAVEFFLGESGAFSVLKPDGSLITQKNADNTVAPHPIFEIRLKRRSTYWCYRSASSKTLSVTPKSALFLAEDGGKLRSKSLKPLTFFPTEFQSDDPGTPAVSERVFLPNPITGGLRTENDRIYSDIYVSPIKGLIDEN